MSATDYSPANGHSRSFDGPVTPPQNLEAEQSVLGAVLLSDTALPALIIDERLQAADFYRESHGLIFTAMLELHGAGEPVDALTLVEHLKQAGQLDAVGGRGDGRPAGGLGPRGRQRPPVRADRPRERDAAAAAQRGLRDPGQGPLPRGAPARARGPRRAHDPRGRPRGLPQGLPLDRGRPRRRDHQARRALPRRQGDHRHRLGLRGPRHDHRRLPARQPDHPRRKTLDGQVPRGLDARLRPQRRGRAADRRARRARSSAARTRSWPRSGEDLRLHASKATAGLRSGVQQTLPADDAAGPPPRRDRQPPAVHARGLARDPAS